MLDFEDYIRRQIIRIFKNRGFDITIGCTKWRGNHLTLDDLLLKKANDPAQYIQIERLMCKLHLYRPESRIGHSPDIILF